MTQEADNEKHSPPNSVEPVGRQRWFIPVITFVVGLLLGGLVIWAVRSGDSGSATPDASTAPTVAATGPTSGSTAAPTTATVVVPAECLMVSEDASTLNDLVRRAVTAARDLDASALSTVVREIDTAQAALRQHADACKDVQASITGGATPSLTTLLPSASTS
ncbi:MAG: hypothetical protein L0H78_16430 [Humibacillus sp.]|nr:hypothetical protein [Humibacillus sp.]